MIEEIHVNTIEKQYKIAFSQELDLCFYEGQTLLFRVEFCLMYDLLADCAFRLRDAAQSGVSRRFHQLLK